MRKLYEVSTKAAIFDKKHEHVLVINMDQIEKYGKNDFGLPGGHIEGNESPDQAIIRELHEECGINPINLQHKDFFTHYSGKLILGYVGSVENNLLKSNQNELEGIPKWLTKSEFEKIPIDDNYRKFVLENWPEK